MEAEHDGCGPSSHDGSEQAPDSTLGITDSRFTVGQLAMTRGVAHEVSNETVLDVLRRHARGDWGDLDEEDKQANEHAVKNDEGRILSAYWVPSMLTADGQVRLYVITESDRSVTTVLLIDEY